MVDGSAPHRTYRQRHTAQHRPLVGWHALLPLPRGGRPWGDRRLPGLLLGCVSLRGRPWLRLWPLPPTDRSALSRCVAARARGVVLSTTNGSLGSCRRCRWRGSGGRLPRIACRTRFRPAPPPGGWGGRWRRPVRANKTLRVPSVTQLRPALRIRFNFRCAATLWCLECDEDAKRTAGLPESHAGFLRIRVPSIDGGDGRVAGPTGGRRRLLRHLEQWNREKSPTGVDQRNASASIDRPRRWRSIAVVFGVCRRPWSMAPSAISRSRPARSVGRVAQGGVGTAAYEMGVVTCPEVADQVSRDTRNYVQSWPRRVQDIMSCSGPIAPEAVDRP